MYKKVLTCDSSGTIATQSKQAYGEWEFDLYKGANAIVVFINDRANRTNDSGYFIYPGSIEEIHLVRRTAGGNSDLFETAASYINSNTWYRLKIARLQSEGVFKDIETLQTSDCITGVIREYSTFTSHGRYGFSAISDGVSFSVAGTEDQIYIENTKKYLVEFDMNLISGTSPLARLRTEPDGGSRSNEVSPVNGRNSFVMIATATITAGFYFDTNATSNFTISGLTIRRIYDADTFAVFIKGGAFGDTETGWTLVDSTGGSGENPITDSTHTTSEYVVLDLDAGDKVTNIKLLNQVNQ